MRRIIPAAALVTTLMVMVALVAVPAGAATLPTTIASNRILFDSNRTGNYELFSMGTDGSAPHQLTADARYDSWWPKLSPNRSQIVFYRTPAGTHDRDYSKATLWRMNADGSGLRRLLDVGAYGWYFHGHAEWSPDGASLVMFGGKQSSPQIWITDAYGGNPRAVTNRPGNNLDPAWSPDGSRIVFVGCPINVCSPSQYEVYVVNRDGTGERRLTNDVARDHDPYFSPDGRHIAWLRQTVSWGIFLMSPTGADQRQVIADIQVNSKPAWSPDSQWIYFHRLAHGRTSFNVFRLRPDGTGLTEIEQRPTIALGPYANEYPVASSF